MNPEFVNLLESLANGVVIADAAGTIIYSNQFLERMFGYDRGELLGQRVEALMRAEVRKLHVHHRAGYNASPETRLMGAGRDLQARRKDGSVFPVEIGLSPITTPEGRQVVAIVTDITKRKRAEQQSVLQKDVALVLSRAESIQDVAFSLLATTTATLGWKVGAFWLVDSEAAVLRNAAVWIAPGVAAAEFEAASRRLSVRMGEGLLGRAWAEGKPAWISDLAMAGGFRRDREAAAAGLRSTFELPILVGSQTLGVLEFFALEVGQPDEAMIEIAVAVASQIGQFVERKRSERALGISQERHRSLFENAVFGIIRSTASGEILDANPALVAMLGYDSADDVLALNCNTDLYKDPQDRQRLVEDSMAADRFDGFEAEWKTKTGGTIQVRLSGRTVRSADGSLAGFEAIVENISHRKQLEQQYQQAQKMEAVGRLAGGVAHDFNNLLTIIAVSSDTLLDHLAHNEAQRQTVEEITRATEQGASLVRQLMAFGRAQPQTPEPVNLNEIVKSSQRMLGILAGEDIRLELKLHSKDCPVAVEQSRLEQVLMNLVANSRDAMPRGGTISITTALVDIDEEQAALYVGLKPATHVKLSVADTGSGIHPEVLPHIFEPFFSTKEKGKGTGLGLSTVYGMVHQHAGHVGCESAVGRGTTFTIFLPAAERGAGAPSKVQIPSKVRQGTETVLLVEDEPGLRASVWRILERNGYNVVAAPDGVEALKASQDYEGEFNLLLTDIALPQMRGTELAERLLQRRPQMRVLYMSGYTDGALWPEVSHFIPKPFRRDALLRKIREVLDS